MAETAASLVAALGRRIRDPNSTAHASASVITLLSHVQRCVNAETGAIKITRTRTLNATVPYPFFDALDDLNNFVRVERVVFNGEDVLRSDWRGYANIDPYWARHSDAQPLMWDMIGRGFLVITPHRTGNTFQITGTKLLDTLSSGGDETELPDHHMPAILAMAEQLLLLRQRLMASMKPSIEQLQKILPMGIP